MTAILYYINKLDEAVLNVGKFKDLKKQAGELLDSSVFDNLSMYLINDDWAKMTKALVQHTPSINLMEELRSNRLCTLYTMARMVEANTAITNNITLVGDKAFKPTHSCVENVAYDFAKDTTCYNAIIYHKGTNELETGLFSTMVIRTNMLGKQRAAFMQRPVDFSCDENAMKVKIENLKSYGINGHNYMAIPHKWDSKDKRIFESYSKAALKEQVVEATIFIKQTIDGNDWVNSIVSKVMDSISLSFMAIINLGIIFYVVGKNKQSKVGTLLIALAIYSTYKITLAKGVTVSDKLFVTVYYSLYTVCLIVVNFVIPKLL